MTDNNSKGFDLSMKGIDRFRQALPMEIRMITPLTGISPGKDFLKIAAASNIQPSERINLLMQNRFSLARQNMGPIRSMMMMIWTKAHAAERVPDLLKEASFRQAAFYMIKSKAPEKMQQMLQKNQDILHQMEHLLESNAGRIFVPATPQQAPAPSVSVPAASPAPASPSHSPNGTASSPSPTTSPS